MNHEIAEVGPEDIDELQELMQRVIAHTVAADELLRADLVQNTLGNLDWWFVNMEKCCHLKCSIDGNIVAVILVKNFWNLCSLFVEPEFQGRGIGRALVEASADSCRGKSEKGALWLNAVPNAIAFYERLGFEERTATRPLPPGFQAMQRAL